MRRRVFLVSGIAVVLAICATRAAFAQAEVYHPGETYDSLQAGRDAYWDAEAERRAKIGRQLMLEEQIQADNTWSDPQDKYRPVRPESYGPIRPQVYTGPTLADAYAYPQGSIVYYNGQPSAPAGNSSYAAPVPAFQSWPRVPGDIYGTPYYGYVRQPIGHVKIWTGRLSYIYKPVYASPAMDPGPSVAAPIVPRARTESPRRSFSAPASPSAPLIPPPPPRPSNPGPSNLNAGQGQEL